MPGIKYSPSATKARKFSAISGNPCNSVLIGYLSNKETGDKLMVRGLDCKVGAATDVHPNFIMASVVCMLFVWSGILSEEQHL
jgi:hypothetical protein